MASLAVLVAATCLPMAAGAATRSVPHDDSVLPTGQIGHVGRWLVDPADRVLLFHGINMVNKQTPYYPAAAGFSDADAQWLAANGIRVVRVGVLATGLMPKPGVINQLYLSHVATTVDDLASNGVYSLIDFHQDGFGPSVGSDGFPAWMTLTGSAVNNHAGFPTYYIDDPATQQAFQSLWQNDKGPGGITLQAQYVAMFHAIAETFKTDPSVLGYDLFNEPWPGTVWSSCLTNPQGCPNLDRSELASLYAKAVTSIRAAGDTHLIFGEPFVLFNFGLSTTSIPLPGGDLNSGLSFHMYTNDPARDPDVIAHARAWSHHTGGALLTTEWGAVTTAKAIERQADELDAGLLPWIFWSMGELVSNLADPPSGSNLISSTVGSLIQPYPLAVAGTPTRLVYVPSTKTMTFSYKTTEPSTTTAYPAGTTTVIEAPETVYPNGYSVSVSGATVTSSPCAPLLTLTNDTDASSASVTVTPGGSC